MSITSFVTIGQSPRDDILQSMLPPALHSRVIQRGALDHLSSEAIHNLAPRQGETPFVTRLVDGAEILVSKTALMPHLQTAVDSAAAAGARSVVILCTGAFPDLRASVPMILPDRVLTANVDALLPRGTIGVVMPHEDQTDLMRSKWETPDRQFVGVAASPYSGASDLRRHGANLADRGADLIVLDCMGFTQEMKSTIAAHIETPVILANRLIGRVIEELTDVPGAGSS